MEIGVCIEIRWLNNMTVTLIKNVTNEQARKVAEIINEHNFSILEGDCFVASASGLSSVCWNIGIHNYVLISKLSHIKDEIMSVFEEPVHENVDEVKKLLQDCIRKLSTTRETRKTSEAQ